MSIKRYEVNGSSSVFEDESGSLVDYQDYAALEAKCAALAEKGMEVVREASLVYSKYNDTQMPDRDIVDQQTLHELCELCAAQLRKGGAA